MLVQYRYQTLVYFEDKSDDVERLMQDKAELLKKRKELREMVSHLEERAKIIS